MNLRTALLETTSTSAARSCAAAAEFDLDKARERAHIVDGLLKALDKHRRDHPPDPRLGLGARPPGSSCRSGRSSFSERQAHAILDMQLRRLAALERQQLEDEYAELLKTIAYLEDLLANPRKIDGVIRDETLELRKKYGDERRTQIVDRSCRTSPTRT